VGSGFSRIETTIDAETAETSNQVWRHAVRTATMVASGRTIMDVETQEALEALRAVVNRLGDRLETAIRDGLSENRRYFDVLTESLRDDIRIIAEGVIALDAKVARLGPPSTPS
jgi:hypothetical protein